MEEASKPPSIPANVTGDLWGLFSIFGAARRRTKLFLYGFAFAFVASTAYLAFLGTVGSTASPWFNNLFISASVSAAPYRSQISSLFSFIFPNPSPEKAGPFPENPAADGDRTMMGLGATIIGAAVRNQTRPAIASPPDGVTVKNDTGKRVETTKGVDLSARNQAKNQTGNGTVSQGSGVTKANRTENGGDKIAGKDGVGFSKDAFMAVKNQTGSGTVLQGNGGATKANQTEKGGKNISAKNGGSKKDAILATQNQTRIVVSPKNDSKNGIGSPKIGNSAAGKNQTGKEATTKGNQASASTQTSSSTITPQENGVAAKKKSSESTSIPGATKSGTPVAKNESTKASAAVPNNTPSPTKFEKQGEASAKDNVSKFTTSVSAFTSSGGGAKKTEDWISGMKGCDIFQGRWVKDDSYPLYPEGSCPHIDEPFNCYVNGRPDRAYRKLRWQPNGCKIPRLNATDMLERLRGKRLVFVGDSLNRNMWESLVCILRNSVKDKKKVFEASGRQEFRTEGSYSFIFKDYNCSVEFFRSPFLVQEWETPISNGKTKETLRLDMIEKSSPKYKDADVLVFNTGHWWTHEKTSKGKDYYQEGNRVYSELNVVNAFHKALNTWARWVDNNVNSKKTLVVFRGYSASHFSGGQWNSGGQCDKETEPIKNEKYLSTYPPKMAILESVFKEMKTSVSYLNITRMTDYRKDAHPSIYRKQTLTEDERRSPEGYQDCSHWCLPGVPDSWNELLYAQLLLKQHQ